MCVIDWTLLGSWVTALATLGLVIVGVVAALYARGATESALEMLRLESEPVLMTSIVPSNLNGFDCAIGVDYPEATTPLSFSDARLNQRHGPGVLVAFENVGRSAALNVIVNLRATRVDLPAHIAEVPFHIQGLAPQKPWIVSIANYTVHPINVDVISATRASTRDPKASVALKMFKSAAFPFAAVPVE